MKYKIHRASAICWKNEIPCPCEESYLENDEWYINVNSLEDLQKLIKKYWKIILTNDTLIIYDDNLE
jgi:hypothetical protein